jgi:hypothetical protein
MWNIKQILNRYQQKGVGILSKLSGQPAGDKKSRTSHQPHRKLAVEDRRHARWSGIREGRASAWDANKVSRRVERVLQPTKGSEESQRISEQKERISRRDSGLARLYENADFQMFWNILRNWEAQGIIDIETPEYRKKNEPITHYYGFCGGRLTVFDDIRSLFLTAMTKKKNGKLLEKQ